jgi:hypothetical protein
MVLFSAKQRALGYVTLKRNYSKERNRMLTSPFDLPPTGIAPLKMKQQYGIRYNSITLL